MTKNVLVIGHRGNMGQRYMAVLKWLHVPCFGFDVSDQTNDLFQKAKLATHIIIATPTKTHCDLIMQMSLENKPILCEKPIATNVDQVKRVLRHIKNNNIPFEMVTQYRELLDKYSWGPTYYDYFKHGQDGLVWDCLQIIGLSKRRPERISEKLPVWECMINGRMLDISQMDAAYISFVEKWLVNPSGNIKNIYKMHLKTHKYLESTKKNEKS